SIRNFKELDVNRPWDAISHYMAPLPTPESFEVYPNRDSIPFMGQYHFDPSWNVKEFVRGTMRLNGWAEAWGDVFTEIETLEGASGDARLKEMSDQFWADNAYDEGEPDRVVLCVALKAEKDGNPIWHQTYVMDAWGDSNGTAMARLVSIPLSLGVEAVLGGKINPGVSAATSDPTLLREWLGEIDTLAQHLTIVDHA
ncbi:MAG: saccharopine dehydrogenase C-terminal domain-containing protein, partial [Planktotalea arctica]